MIRVGLVGAGPWAGLFTAPMLSAADDLTFAAVWARRVGAEFVRTIRGERSQRLDVHRGVHLQRLIAAVAESLDTAKVVTFR